MVSDVHGIGELEGLKYPFRHLRSLMFHLQTTILLQSVYYMHLIATCNCLHC